MIRHLIDSSALWRVMRDDALRSAWTQVITSGAVGSCHPQRAEFRRSARNLDEYEQMSAMFDELYPDAPVPKSAWHWIEAAQHRLVRHGAQGALSVVDLLIAATAAHHGHVVLHDDNDFVVGARHIPDLVERNVHDTPPPS
ncbi:MAG TPA: PIN domain-containing protein [Acidimicrobiales bacterium]|nr:PIN domain-containing protein [Acidimicrobiales bacterium]